MTPSLLFFSLLLAKAKESSELAPFYVFSDDGKKLQGVCGTPSGQKVFFSLAQFNHAATPLKSCHCWGATPCVTCPW